jgi:hypothetical protein
LNQTSGAAAGAVEPLTIALQRFVLLQGLEHTLQD